MENVWQDELVERYKTLTGTFKAMHHDIVHVCMYTGEEHYVMIK